MCDIRAPDARSRVAVCVAVYVAVCVGVCVGVCVAVLLQCVAVLLQRVAVRLPVHSRVELWLAACGQNLNL